MTNLKIAVMIALAMVNALAVPTLADAESILELVSGFDEARIDAAYPIQDPQSLSESAKLLYRVRRVSPTIIDSKIADQSPGADAWRIGMAVKISGEIVALKNLRVPDELSEFIGLSAVSLVTIRPEGTPDSPANVEALASVLPAQAKAGDRVQTAGMVIETADSSGESSAAIAAARLVWIPEQSPIPDWQWLADHGVDLSLLPAMATRDRRDLVAEDADVFYPMMAAAAKATTDTSDDLPPPPTVDPISLLKQSKTLTGRFLRLPVEIVQITRVSVNEPHRIKQLGADHYFQIDAVGDLGEVVVKIEPTDPAGTPAVFENRYPISLVARELPGFLVEEMRRREGGDAVISTVSMRVQVDAFFLRLWSYRTEFMKQFGDQKQFGPLIVAARWENLESDSADPIGVSVIGYLAAIGTAIAILGTWVFLRVTSAGDKAARHKRREKMGPPDDSLVT